MSGDSVWQVSDLSVAYGDRLVLEHIDLEVGSGLVMGIVGPNGAGKSTLIKASLGLVPSLLGTSTFFGRPLSAVRARVGYMPQSSAIDWDFPTTVGDLVLMGTYGSLGWLRRPGRSQREAAARAMAQTGITDLARRQIGELSGGQRQRALLARTLAADPRLCFMDEPFQGIDARTQEAIVGVIGELRSAGRTVVLVHHDLRTVPDYCDEVTLLGEGLVASGPVREAFTPEHIARAFGLPDEDGVPG